MKKPIEPTIALCKHHSENRYLMCWYKLKTSEGTFKFRSDAVCTTVEEDSLHQLHCNYLGATLLEKCLPILNKYHYQILALCKDAKKESEMAFSFPGPKVVRIK